MPRRILLVEDEPLSRDLVSGLLQAKGYEVETASDGVSGVERLMRGRYDLALMDYHLPEVDGYASAKLLGTMLPSAERPKLVALTADPRSLSERQASGTLFDAVLPKPFNPIALCELVERLLSDPEQEDAARASAELWRARGLNGRPRAFAAPEPTVAQAAMLRRWFDLVGDPRSADLLLLTNPDRIADLASARRQGAAHLLPAVDLTGERSRELDASFRPEDPQSWTAVATAVRRFASRAAKLAPAARFSHEPGVRLLGQLYVSDRALEPIPDPNDRRFYGYSGAAGGETLTAAADELVTRGLLAKSFAERFHACVECDSHRLNVREECSACRSPHLTERRLLRHIRCGTVAPEDEFHHADGLMCRKCDAPLGRYGEGYLRAGKVMRCDDCLAPSREPSIGFVCLDCGCHADGALVETRDVHAYGLTARGVRLVTLPDTFAPLPGPQAVREIAARLIGEGRNAVVGELRFAAAERVIATEGWAAFESLRRLFFENLEELLGDAVQVVSGADSDFIVLLDVTAEEFAASERAIVHSCETTLEQPLGARVSILHAA